LSTYLAAAIAIYTYIVKGISALHFYRDLDVQYKTAFALARKLRESLLDDKPVRLDDDVEVGAV